MSCIAKTKVTRPIHGSKGRSIVDLETEDLKER